jgi:hypothetical protein
VPRFTASVLLGQNLVRENFAASKNKKENFKRRKTISLRLIAYISWQHPLSLVKMGVSLRKHHQ